MNNIIKDELFKKADSKYKEFSTKLIPDSKPLIGVRLPKLRQYAKDIVNGKYDYTWEEALKDENDDYFEEIMLRGMLIGYGSSKYVKNIDEALAFLDKFVPLVDNWSVCDSFCVSFSVVQKNMEETWNHIQKYLYSDKEFEVRVGLILILNQFLKFDENGHKIPRKKVVTMDDLNDKHEQDGLYTQRILEVINREFSQGYYAQMAAAWLVAESFVIFPNATLELVKNNKMDDFTYKKSLQKICESRIPDKQVKEYIRKI